MELIPREEIEYEPEWNEETQMFEDVCPFQARRRGNPHVCYCMNKQNERVVFSNASQFNAHILTKFHKLGLDTFVTKKMILLKKELDRALREKAALHVSVEAELAREKRVQAELRGKLQKQKEKYMKDITELNEKLIRAESLLHLQSEETELYFLKK
jgi:hypothetical protein